MIKSVTYLILFHSTIYFCNAQQKADKLIYRNLDTISLYYPPNTFDTLNDSANRYYVNGIRVDKKTSDISYANATLIDSCRPCILKIYNSTGLLTCGVQSGDRRTGFWYEYYPKTNRVKVKGHYKETSTGNCTSPVCSTEDGEWFFYSEKGKLIKREVYLKGKLVSKKKF